MIEKFLKLSLVYMIAIILILIPTSNVSAWDGTKDGKGTHSLIVTQAIEMIENDMASTESDILKNNFKILKNNLHKLQLGSTFPDYDPNAYDLYQDHFWDPDTGHNFSLDNKWYVLSPVYENAESQVRKFTALAKNEWAKGNYEESVFLLGQAMHYLGDLNTPYHAANVTALDTPGHEIYEAYVDKHRDEYKIHSANCKTNEDFYANTLKELNFGTWSKNFSTYWAKQAKNLYYSHSTMSHSWDDWNYSGIHAIYNSQMSTAGFIYRFLNEVSNTLPTAPNSKVNELIVIIKTADELYAGTDHYVYFGFETNDGKKFEWNLDNPGNDFERNQVDSYIINIENGGVNLNDISKLWIRKSKYSIISDDWKPEYIKIIANGSVKYEQTINEWFGNYKTYYLNKSLK